MTRDEAVDRGLAHAILRLTLGVNICFHGVARFSHLAPFAQGVITQFHSILPQALVVPYAYGLPFAEAAIGALLIAGVANRTVLVLGALLMTSLTFGTALREQHTVLAEQFAYELVYFLLLATLRWDRYSVDALARVKRNRGTSPASARA